MNTSIENSPNHFSSMLQHMDKVIGFLILAICALFVIDAGQGMESLVFIIDAVLYILPFLLFAVLLAASLKATGADGTVVKAFSGHPVKAVVIAALFGALSPFCSCGVIPLIATMLVSGVPLAPVMAFWIASPIMDPEMFILTSAGISVEFAMAKAGFAIAVGLFAGFMVLVVQRSGGLLDVLKEGVGGSSCVTSCGTKQAEPVQWKFWNSTERVNAFFTEFRQTTFFLGKWLTLAFFLESLMVAYIEPAWIQQYLSGESLFTIPLAAIVGMPSYLNGYAAIPLVGGLIDMGMSSGAAMAFMIAGAVSSIPAAVAVYALVKLRVFFLYLGIGLFGSVSAGAAYSMALAA